MEEQPSRQRSAQPGRPDLDDHHRFTRARENGGDGSASAPATLRRGISMRWWLAAAFATVAAITAVSVAALFSQRSDSAVREGAEASATARAFAAAEDVARSSAGGSVHRDLSGIAGRHNLTLFLYDDGGRLVASAGAASGSLGRLPFRNDAIRDALAGHRFVDCVGDGRETIVGVPFRRGPIGAMLAVSERRELPATLGIVRRKIVEAAALAVLVGALAGLLIASLIAARLRRIARAAAAIEAGDFTRPLLSGFDDELGGLARTVDRMRTRLATSFTAVENERDRLERILGRLREGVVAVNRDLTVAFANPEAGHILGRPLRRGAALPDPWHEFSLRDFAHRLFEGSGSGELSELAHHDGETFGVVGITPQGAETAVLVLSNISQAERHELAEREFVTNAAHELRTPLQTIVGAVEMLQAGAKENAGERDMLLGHVERESARLRRLVGALLVLARAQRLEETPRLEPVDLRGLLHDIAGGVRPKPGVRVAVECPPGLVALTHRDLIEQALANLASNAAKNTFTGSVVLSARAASDGIVAEVADTGTGIEQEHRRRVPERFYRGGRRSGDGFGLGLAIASQAVRAVGGSFELESEPGRGTTARVTLPAVEERAA